MYKHSSIRKAAKLNRFQDWKKIHQTESNERKKATHTHTLNTSKTKSFSEHEKMSKLSKVNGICVLHEMIPNK